MERKRSWSSSALHLLCSSIFVSYNYKENLDHQRLFMQLRWEFYDKIFTIFRNRQIKRLWRRAMTPTHASLMVCRGDYRNFYHANPEILSILSGCGSPWHVKRDFRTGLDQGEVTFTHQLRITSMVRSQICCLLLSSLVCFQSSSKGPHQGHFAPSPLWIYWYFTYSSIKKRLHALLNSISDFDFSSVLPDCCSLASPCPLPKSLSFLLLSSPLHPEPQPPVPRLRWIADLITSSATTAWTVWDTNICVTAWWTALTTLMRRVAAPSALRVSGAGRQCSTLFLVTFWVPSPERCCVIIIYVIDLIDDTYTQFIISFRKKAMLYMNWIVD